MQIEQAFRVDSGLGVLRALKGFMVGLKHQSALFNPRIFKARRVGLIFIVDLASRPTLEHPALRAQGSALGCRLNTRRQIHPTK